MVDRVNCCIPDCRRSFKAEVAEPHEFIMCGRCWRSADPALTRRHKTVQRRSVKALRLLQRNAIRKKPGYAARVRRLYRMFDDACSVSFSAVRRDAEFRSAMRIEGTAGALAAKRGSRA